MTEPLIFAKSPRLPARHRLLRDLVLLVLVVGAALVGVALFLAAQTRQDLAASLTVQTAQKAREEFVRAIDPIRSTLAVIAGWGEEGQIDLADPRGLNAKFIPILQEMPNAAGLLLADDRGREYLLSADEGSWLTRTRHADGEGGELIWSRWGSPGEQIQSWSERRDYDPRQRPWFEKALASPPGEVAWTEPYRFFSSRQPGLTAVIRWAPAAAPATHMVAGIDLQLADIFSTIEQLPIGDHGGAFLVSPRGQVLDASRNATLARIQVRSAAQWGEQGGTSTIPFALRAGGQTWWCGFQPLGVAGDTSWIGIAVPEADLLGGARRDPWTVVGWVLGVLGAGILLALVLVRKYRFHFRETPVTILGRPDLEPQLGNLIAQGENPFLEFKSTVRTNLKSGKPGKEIELAWLKTTSAFLNTRGGTLLLGVNDEGEVLGLGADDFQNDDKCRLHLKNLIHQHIGPEFSKFIHFDIVPFSGNKLVVLECEPAAQPAFLCNGQNEDFYIRSGPASVRLSISQALDYLKHRK